MGKHRRKRENHRRYLSTVITPSLLDPHERAFQEGLALIQSGNYLEAAFKIVLADGLGSIKAQKLYAKKSSLHDFLDASFESHCDVFNENNLKDPDGVTHFKLATCALLGIGTEQDDLKAFEYYRLAAEQGDASAQSHLAWMYRQSRAEPALTQAERDAKVCHYYQLAAEQGLATAQSNLAWMYEEGRAEPALPQAKREAKAYHYYQLAAEQGEAGAQNKLAWMYFKSRAEPTLSQAERDVIACHYFKLAAEQGHAIAQFNLASMYYRGRAEPALFQAERDVIACRYFKLAADQGQVDAQNNLAAMYSVGRAEPTLSQAERDVIVCRYFKLAADQGNAAAQNHLARMYYLGRAELTLSQAERDVIVCRYFKLAAEQGKANAQNNLAGMYYLGRAEPTLSQAERGTKACHYWKLAIQGGQKKEVVQFFQKHYSMSERLSGFLVDLIETPLPTLSDEIDMPKEWVCAITFSLPRVPVRLFGQGPYCLFSLMQCRVDPQTNQAFSYATDVHPAYDIRDQIIRYATSDQAPAASQLAKPLSRSAFFQEAGCQTEALPQAPTVTPTF